MFETTQFYIFYKHIKQHIARSASNLLVYMMAARTRKLALLGCSGINKVYYMGRRPNHNVAKA
jgi:hypothetical protein